MRPSHWGLISPVLTAALTSPRTRSAAALFSEETKLVFDYGFLKLRRGSVKTRADGDNPHPSWRLEYLAALIAEAVDTDTTTQLVELRVAGDPLERPVLKVVRASK